MGKKIMICTAALLLILSGCRSATETTQPTQTTVAPTTRPATQPTTRPTTAPTETTQATPLFEETVLVDSEDCMVKVVGVDPNGLWGYTLKVYLENRTDVNLMFTVEDAAVNGFMCDPFWASEVRAGMKANEEISFSHDDLANNGITKVTEILFTLRAYDTDDWTKEDYVNQSVTIHP